MTLDFRIGLRLLRLVLSLVAMSRWPVAIVTDLGLDCPVPWVLVSAATIVSRSGVVGRRCGAMVGLFAKGSVARGVVAVAGSNVVVTGIGVKRLVGGRSGSSVIRVDLMVAIILVTTVVSRGSGPVVPTRVLIAMSGIVRLDVDMSAVVKSMVAMRLNVMSFVEVTIVVMAFIVMSIVVMSIDVMSVIVVIVIPDL